VNIDWMDKEVLGNGEKASVKCRFLYHTEHLKEGLEFMLREGRTKVYGKVLAVYPKE